MWWAQLIRIPGTNTLPEELLHEEAGPQLTTKAGRSGFGVITLLPDARCRWTLAGLNGQPRPAIPRRHTFVAAQGSGGTPSHLIFSIWRGTSSIGVVVEPSSGGALTL